MRHRGVSNHEERPTTGPGRSGTVLTRSDLVAMRLVGQGRHSASPTSLVPEQALPTHESMMKAAPPVVVAPTARPVAEPASIPDTAHWRASHVPRLLAGIILFLAVLGTGGLGVRYADGLNENDFVDLMVGVSVVVALWAVLVASTPQQVSLRGSMLTVHNTAGSETFDLADALQPVDLVGDPRTPNWALLLHHADASTVVLRRHDVLPGELDPIVRHYRAIADRRHAERDARFNR